MQVTKLNHANAHDAQPRVFTSWQEKVAFAAREWAGHRGLVC